MAKAWQPAVHGLWNLGYGTVNVHRHTGVGSPGRHRFSEAMRATRGFDLMATHWLPGNSAVRPRSAPLACLPRQSHTW